MCDNMDNLLESIITIINYALLVGIIAAYVWTKLKSIWTMERELKAHTDYAIDVIKQHNVQKSTNRTRKLNRRRKDLELLKQKCKDAASDIAEMIVVLEQQATEKQRIKVELENRRAIKGLYKLIADKLYNNVGKYLYNLTNATETFEKVIEDAPKEARNEKERPKRDEEPGKSDEKRAQKVSTTNNFVLETSLRLKKFELIKAKIQATQGSFLYL